jgi:hypothetical protein
MNAPSVYPQILLKRQNFKELDYLESLLCEDESRAGGTGFRVPS